MLLSYLIHNYVERKTIKPKRQIKSKLRLLVQGTYIRTWGSYSTSSAGETGGTLKEK